MFKRSMFAVVVLVLLAWSAASAAAASPWKVMPSPSPDASNELTAVAAINSKDVWAVGSHAADDSSCPCVVFPLAEHWDGQAWTVDSPAGVPDAGATTLSAVTSITGTHDVWAVGGWYDNLTLRPVAYRHSAGGWQRMPLPDLGGSGTLFGVTSNGAADAWAVGTMTTAAHGTRPLVLHWNGSSWSAMDTSALAQNGTLRSVAYVGKKTLYAVGDVSSFGQPSQPMMVKVAATRVKQVASPLATLDGMLTAVTAVPQSRELWATGIDNTTADAVFLHFDGTAWSLRSRIAGGAQGSVTAFSANDVWAAGGGIEHWNGIAWTHEDVTTGSFPYLRAIVAAPHSHTVWAVGVSSGDTLIVKRSTG